MSFNLLLKNIDTMFSQGFTYDLLIKRLLLFANSIKGEGIGHFPIIPHRHVLNIPADGFNDNKWHMCLLKGFCLSTWGKMQAGNLLQINLPMRNNDRFFFECFGSYRQFFAKFPKSPIPKSAPMPITRQPKVMASIILRSCSIPHI